MSDQQVSPAQAATLGNLAQGAIGPEPRIATREISEQQVNDFVVALHGDSLFAQTDLYVPHKCVDGRPRLDGVNTLGPDAAGGTESLVVGDALTFEKFRSTADTASMHTKHVLQFWLERGQQVGGHDADTAHGGSGCGACDKLEACLDYIARRGDDIRAALATLGVVADDATHQAVIANARKLVEKRYSDGGPNIIAAMRETGGENAVETLTGDHKEVAVVINTRSNTTLNRAQARMDFGDQLQAFNVDIWALEQSANDMYDDPAKAHALYYASLCYNVAVAAVLSGKSLRVVVR